MKRIFLLLLLLLFPAVLYAAVTRQQIMIEQRYWDQAASDYRGYLILQRHMVIQVMRYTRFQTAELDTSLPKFPQSIVVMGPAGLLVTVLMIGDEVGGLLITGPPGRGRQTLSPQPGVGGLAHLFDRQVARGERFFL